MQFWEPLPPPFSTSFLCISRLPDSVPSPQSAGMTLAWFTWQWGWSTGPTELYFSSEGEQLPACGKADFVQNQHPRQIT